MITPIPVCPLDGCQMQSWITVPLDWRRPEVEEAYQLYWCAENDFGMIYPRPTLKSVPAFYDVAQYYTRVKDKTPSNQNKDYSFATWLQIRLSWQVDRSDELESKWVNTHFGTAPTTILDIGCGNGNMLGTLSAQGHTVCGVEPDELARQIAVQRGFSVYSGTAEQLPAEIENRQFDAVIMIHVLEHCLDPIIALQNAYQLLKPGGILVAETPNNEAVGSNFAGITWRWLDVPRHLNFFTLHSLQKICKLAGLHPETTEYRGYCRQFQPDWLEDEQHIWDIYQQYANGQTKLPARNSRWRNWQLLLKTMFAKNNKKYDSVRVIARKPERNV